MHELVKFRRERQRWTLRPLRSLGGTRLNQVLFCATKADQASRDTRKNMSQLLEQLVCNAATELSIAELQQSFCSVAAYQSTEDAEAQGEDNVRRILGQRLGFEEKECVYPGDVPDSWPRFEAEWGPFRFPDFEPHALPDIVTGEPLPNIGMDLVMYRLVEEVLQ